jgi:hypothetical protein
MGMSMKKFLSAVLTTVCVASSHIQAVEFKHDPAAVALANPAYLHQNNGETAENPPRRLKEEGEMARRIAFESLFKTAHTFVESILCFASIMVWNRPERYHDWKFSLRTLHGFYVLAKVALFFNKTPPPVPQYPQLKLSIPRKILLYTYNTLYYIGVLSIPAVMSIELLSKIVKSRYDFTGPFEDLVENGKAFLPGALGAGIPLCAALIVNVVEGYKAQQVNLEFYHNFQARIEKLTREDQNAEKANA